MLAKHGHKLHPAYKTARHALRDEVSWTIWVSIAKKIHSDVDAWLGRVDARVRRQLRLKLEPRTTGALEQAVLFVRRSMGYRRTGFRNQDRTNRLLAGDDAHLNGLDDSLLFTHVLHMWIERQQQPGRPAPGTW